MPPPLRILISNDDGYQAPGITALAAAVGEIAEVHIVAPATNHSGTSSSITLAEIKVATISDTIHAVHGYPSDCVQLALHTDILPWRPDLTITGINSGANITDGTIHSGTVAAAGESMQAGIPAIAFSLAEPADGYPPTNFAAAAQVAKGIVEKFAARLLQQPMVLNVNIPDLPLAEIKATKLCKLGRREATRQPNAVGNGAAGTYSFTFAEHHSLQTDTDLDHVAVDAGCVTITPLQFNLIDHNNMETVSQWLK